jgi:hypothetical protein
MAFGIKPVETYDSRICAINIDSNMGPVLLVYVYMLTECTKFCSALLKEPIDANQQAAKTENFTRLDSLDKDLYEGDLQFDEC